ncbi:MAG TPA: hypothetical protein VGN81_09595 [Pseudonocardiaceae bacterium]
MTDSRPDQLREYFTPLGLDYHGDRRDWRHNGTDQLDGRYRDIPLHVNAERAQDGQENTGNSNVTNDSMYRPLYRNYLQVSVELTPPATQPVILLPRDHYALLDRHGFPVVNGKVVMARGPNVVGQDLTRSWYVAVNRLLDSGIPEFDALFGILCDDERYAATLLPGELLRWIAADQRSHGARLLFKKDRASIFLRTDRLPEPPELFVPDWIFPAADYLLELLNHR